MIDTLNVRSLAHYAQCDSPETDQGRTFLLEVADEAYEARSEVADGGDAHDEAARIADEAVYRLESRGTFGKWQAFVDLCAYTEDAAHELMKMDDAANMALYQIAERLAYMILDADDEVCGEILGTVI